MRFHIARPMAHLSLLLLLLPVSDAFTPPSFGFSQLLRNSFAAEEKAPDLSSEQQQRIRGDQLLKKLDLESSAEPNVFSVADGAFGDVIAAAQPGLVRLGCGSLVQGYKIEVVDKDTSKYSASTIGDDKQLLESGTVDDVPQLRPIVMYERHDCPYCKLVREACSILALDVQVKPCPKNGKVHTADLPDGATVPRLEDPNTTVRLGGDTKEIVEYLFRVYGGPDGQSPPWALKLDPVSSGVTWASFGLLLRSFLDATVNMGSAAKKRNRMYTEANRPAQPLRLYTYETSPYGALVQRRLDALELEHVITYAPRGSANRQMVYEMLSDLRSYNDDGGAKQGYFQVPLLMDPNTGVRLLESSAICEYLNKQYGVRTPVKYL